jgi:hypothetical protein
MSTLWRRAEVSSNKWAFRFWWRRWDLDKLQTYYKGKQGSVMIWAAIGGDAKKSELIVIARDKTSQKAGYSSTPYTDTLEERIVLIYNGETVVQDSAPIHTSGHTIN